MTTAVAVPTLPDGFRIVARLRSGDIYVELIDYRDFSLESFRKRESVKPDTERAERLLRYGIHVADVRCGTSRRKVKRAVRHLSQLAWLAATESVPGFGPEASS